MAGKKKRFAIALAIALVLIGTSTVAYILLRDEGTDYITMYEFYQHPEFDYYRVNGEFREGLTFSIRDKVTDVGTMNLPTLVSKPNQTGIGFDLGNTTTLTYVMFERLDGYVFFLDNATERFPVGEIVKFELKTQEYLLHWEDGGDGSYETLVEPELGRILYEEYYLSWGGGDYSIAQFEVQLIDDSSRIRLEVKEIGDFFPMPFTWRNVTAIMCQKLWCQGSLAQPDVNLYDVDNSLLGKLDSSNRNLSIDSEIEPGQYVLIDYDPGYSGHVFLFRVVTDQTWDNFPWGHVEIP